MNMTTEQEEIVDDFVSGLKSLSANNGKFYLCTEHYGQAVKLDGHAVCGKVKLANPPKRVEFFEIPYMNDEELGEYLSNPDAVVGWTNTRHLYWRIKETFPETTVALTKGRIYVNGYKISWQKLGYEIYDRYRKKAINQQPDNSDYWNSELVLPLIQEEADYDRMEAIRESAEKKRKTILLKSYADYKAYIAGKSESEASPIIEHQPNVTDPRELFMDDLRDYLDGHLEEKKVRIRYKKRTKHFADSGRRLLNFLVWTEHHAQGKITRKELLDRVENSLY